MARKMSGGFSHFYTAVVKGLSEIEEKSNEFLKSNLFSRVL